jgi:hypothetical protein
MPHRALALALAATAACSPPAVAPEVRTARPAKSAAPAAVKETAALAANSAPPPSVQELAARVAEAYDRRARGETAGAAAAFAALVKELVALGQAKAAGVGGAAGDVVKGRTHAGLTVRAGARRETWFFAIETGEPFAYFPEMALKRGAPPLDGSYFEVLLAGERSGLFDPTRKRSATLPGALISLHPDGHRAFVLGEDCRIREVGLEKGEVIRPLAAHAAKSWSLSHVECDGAATIIIAGSGRDGHGGRPALHRRRENSPRRRGEHRGFTEQ